MAIDSEKQTDVDKILNGTKRHPGGLRAKSWPNRYKSVLKTFNQLRRLELADENLLVDCYTCDVRICQRMKWNGPKTDCGHFMPTGYRFTCFDRRNTRIQCVACNRHLSGNQAEYERRLEIELPGQGKLMRSLALANQNYRHTLEQLACLKWQFRRDIRAEARRRGIKVNPR